MDVTDPYSRLIRRRLRLSEFPFELHYKKGILNSQADALSRLTTSGETTVDKGEKYVPYFHLKVETDHSYKDEYDSDNEGIYSYFYEVIIDDESSKKRSNQSRITTL